MENQNEQNETEQKQTFWLRIPRWIRITLLVSLFTVAVLLLMYGAGWWYLHPDVNRTNGIVYGSRNGEPLTMDMIRPENPNGLSVALMVSGGWKSRKSGEARAFMVAPLIRKGYTVFAVYHISQPEANVMEIIKDVHRAIRFIRHNAEEYEIDPDHIGVTGGSAGGHLSLMLATQGAPGPKGTNDPVDQESSAVQAAALFFPVTDLLNLGQSTENLGDGGMPKSFTKSFGPDASDMARWKEIGRECSPIYHITSEMPPVLIHHGDADTLTPLEQSEWFCEAAQKKGVDVELVVHPGGEHGWSTMVWDFFIFGGWFDQHLKKN